MATMIQRRKTTYRKTKVNKGRRYGTRTKSKGTKKS